MSIKKTKQEQLEAKRERILALIAKDTARAGRVVDGLGHGYAMRAYSRLKHMSNRVGDELKDRLDAVEKELLGLGWADPSTRPVPPRTPTQILFHYCEVMELNFEEEMAKINARESGEIAPQGTEIAFIPIRPATVPVVNPDPFMAHPLANMNPAQLAAQAAKLCKANQCDSRDFDDCFEMGRGEEVVAEFVKLYKKDTRLAQAVVMNDRYIGIANWLLTAERVNNPLFAEPA